MIRSIRKCKTTLNRIRRFRIVASLAAVLGCLSGIALVPAHADTFPRTLSVDGRFDVVTTSLGTNLRVEWNFPAPPPGTAWEPTFHVDALPITCRALPGIRPITPDFGPGLSGSRDFVLSEPAFHAGASYYVRVCLRLGDGTVHETNQVEIRLVTIVGTRPASPLSEAPQITGTLAANPVRPGYWIGVTGRGFGERPGAVLLETGGASHRLTDLDWHGRAIAGRVPRIEGVPDGPAFLVVQHASGSSNRWPVNFVATREVRVVPGGEFHVDSCSDEADSNSCGSGAYSGAPSFEAVHSSYIVIAAAGERGVDQFSVPLANGWRFHELEYAIGNRNPPPTWATRDRDSSRPHVQVHWHNPGGFGEIVRYGFNLYIIGPAGVPHR